MAARLRADELRGVPVLMLRSIHTKAHSACKSASRCRQPEGLRSTAGGEPPGHGRLGHARVGHIRDASLEHAAQPSTTRLSLTLSWPRPSRRFRRNRVLLEPKRTTSTIWKSDGTALAMRPSVAPMHSDQRPNLAEAGPRWPGPGPAMGTRKLTLARWERPGPGPRAAAADSGPRPAAGA